jgi:hypothetical protein
MPNYFLNKANSNKFNFWICPLILIIIILYFTINDNSRSQYISKHSTYISPKSRSQTKSRLYSKTISSKSQSNSRYNIQSSELSLSDKIKLWFSNKFKKGTILTKNKKYINKIKHTYSSSKSQSNIRINSPNTAYYIHNNTPHLCLCKKHKDINIYKSVDININDIIKDINIKKQNRSNSVLSYKKKNSSTSIINNNKKNSTNSLVDNNESNIISSYNKNKKSNFILDNNMLNLPYENFELEQYYQGISENLN